MKIIYSNGFIVFNLKLNLFFLFLAYFFSFLSEKNDDRCSLKIVESSMLQAFDLTIVRSNRYLRNFFILKTSRNLGSLAAMFLG